RPPAERLDTVGRTRPGARARARAVLRVRARLSSKQAVFRLLLRFPADAPEAGALRQGGAASAGPAHDVELRPVEVLHGAPSPNLTPVGAEGSRAVRARVPREHGRPPAAP